MSCPVNLPEPKLLSLLLLFDATLNSSIIGLQGEQHGATSIGLILVLMKKKF